MSSGEKEKKKKKKKKKVFKTNKQKNSKLVSEHSCGLLDARLRPRDSVLLHLEPFELENVVSFLGGANAALRCVFADDSLSVASALASSRVRGAVVSRAHIRQYYHAIAELESTPYGENYRFSQFPDLKMLLQTGRDPVPGFYTYESTFVSGAMPDPLPSILQQLKGDSEVALSLGDKSRAYSHAALIKVNKKKKKFDFFF